ncbi:hypothetical protein B0H16DRAFT_1469106 [Mycena metata]|uniref:Uncharacterized protein n=1 Tax=Mycena metata TaxID=1033252 RepID=A0AAD7MTL7_9AGAR|nr:hypothetical protein B0H16DRAFT_1469106 [Mycena metata]
MAALTLSLNLPFMLRHSDVEFVEPPPTSSSPVSSPRLPPLDDDSETFPPGICPERTLCLAPLDDNPFPPRQPELEPALSPTAPASDPDEFPEFSTQSLDLSDPALAALFNMPPLTDEEVATLFQVNSSAFNTTEPEFDNTEMAACFHAPEFDNTEMDAPFNSPEFDKTEMTAPEFDTTGPFQLDGFNFDVSDFHVLLATGVPEELPALPPIPASSPVANLETVDSPPCRRCPPRALDANVKLQ